MKVLLASLLLLTLVSVSCFAAYAIPGNWSFENYAGDPSGFGAQAYGWTGRWGGFDFNVVTPGGPWDAPEPVDGSVVAICKASGTSPDWWIPYIDSAPIAPGVYSVSMWLNRYWAADTLAYPMIVEMGLASDPVSIALTDRGWQQHTITVRSTEAWSVRLRLLAHNDDRCSFDGGSVTFLEAVPEPAGLLVLAVGLCGIIARRRAYPA